MNKAEQKFIKYTSQFDLFDKDIYGKLTHSFRVEHQSGAIADSLNLSEKEISLAQDIGILHDIGRFTQFEKYHSFKDAKTIDHGDYGFKYLITDNNIKDYNDDRNNDRIMGLAIKSHNKFQIPSDLTEKEQIFCKIVRDADKIDILNRVAIIRDIEMKPASKVITKEALEAVKNKRPVDIKYSNTPSDSILTMLGLVYDINYDYSFDYLEKNDIIEQMYQVLHKPLKLERQFEQTDKYIRRRSR